jgi:transcriptional regulator with XRE-family HTH domain
MTIDAVAKRSGVSSSTVERMLSGRHGSVSFKTVQQIAAVLGAEVRIEGIADIAAMRMAQAEYKARRLAAASPSADSAVNFADAAGAPTVEAAREALVQQSIHKLLAGSNRKLWAD